MATSKTHVGNLLVQHIQGFPLFRHRIYNPECIQQTMDCLPKDGDTILFAYPKTGSTWILYMVWNILHKCEGSLVDLSDILVAETHSKEVIDNLPEPRFYKYHLPADRMRINPKTKYIYVHRNPADVVISFYHFFKTAAEVDFDFDSFFEAFMVGDVPYGDVCDHALAANVYKNDENFLMVSYEEAKRDPLDTVKRLAAFLGGKYHESLVKNPSLAERVVAVTKFDHMKENVPFKFVPATKPMDYYYRKGQVGEGRSRLTDEQKKRLEAKIRLKMAGTDFVDLWLN